MSKNTSRQGGSTSYQQGNLKRPLPVVTVALFDNFADGFITTPKTATARIRGITPNMNVQIAAGIILGASNQQPLYPPLPGTLKVTPYVMTADGEILYLKSLTLAPQVLPASYSLGPGLLIGATADNPDYGTSLCDGAIVEVEIDPAQYATSVGMYGRCVVAITATYNGQWWDIETFSNLVSQLTIDACTPLKVQTPGV